MSFDFTAVAPLGFVVFGAFAALAANAASRRALAGVLRGRAGAGGVDAAWDPRAIVADARIGTALAMLCGVCLGFAVYTASYAFTLGARASFDPHRPLLSLDPLSSFAIALVCASSLLCVVLSIAYLPAMHIRRGEHYGLLMLSTAGITLLVSSVDFVLFFLGVELMTLPLYVLVGLDLRRARSAEAALKLAVTSVFASALLLFGLALLYGASGQTSIAGLRGPIAEGDALALAGLALVLAGFGFKLAAFPFHGWAPDVLHGAPTVVASFFASAVKTACFVGAIRFLALALPEPAVASGPAERVHVLLSVLAAATLLVGSGLALVQTNVKRMIAHAGVAHAGMMLLGLACATERAHGAVLFYLLAYSFMSLGVFAVLISMSGGGRDCERIDQFAGLGTRHPVLAAAMALFLLALAGMPGTAGFMARFELFVSAVEAGEIVLVLIASFASLMLLACHLRIVIAMYMRTPSARTNARPASGELLVLSICAAAVLYLGFVAHADPFGTGFRALEAARWAAGSG